MFRRALANRICYHRPVPAIARRKFLRQVAFATAPAVLAGSGCRATRGASSRLALSSFSADVTVPIGHALMGGGIAPAKTVVDPLFARGLVLQGRGEPVVIVAVDWCEIRNDAYERWRMVLAEAAGTSPERVLVSSVHVHDAPIADLEAERLLRAHKSPGSICDLEFHERAVRRVAAALRNNLGSARIVTHVGTGQARVDQVASNRRYLLKDGRPTFGRTSATRDPLAHAAPEGTIDPWLKTLSFWEGDTPLAALHCYATHPMSYYGRGDVSADFVGMARSRRQLDDPRVFQVYASGCSGDVTAGKHNDGAPENRAELAKRIHAAMVGAWVDTRRHPLRTLSFRSVPLRLEPRNSPGFTVEDLEKRLATDPKPFGQCLAALGLSWRKRADVGHRINVPVLDFGVAQLLLLPAESYVEYQLFAQQQRPDSFVVTLGYGECAPGYIPTERAWEEGDSNLGDWCWVAPGSESAMKQAIRDALA